MLAGRERTKTDGKTKENMGDMDQPMEDVIYMHIELRDIIALTACHLHSKICRRLVEEGADHWVEWRAVTSSKHDGCLTSQELFIY